MPNENPTLKDLLKDLLAMREHTFPLKCPTCGKVYPNLAEFVRLTGREIKEGGPLQTKADEEKPIAGVFRDCACGETLLALFQDRRDESAAGVRRRDTFGQLIEALKGTGLSAAAAREELLKVMQGQDSELARMLSEPDSPAQ